MKKVYIDPDINIIEGVEAEKLLAAKNDKKYLVENVGIIKVDNERWKEAQKYERKTWCDSPAKNMGTDRNEEHEKHFQGYGQLNFLLPNNISIIELGCGPFTNLRLIMSSLYKTFSRIDLLDPLIEDYVKNTTNCTYKYGTLNNFKINTITTPIENFAPACKYQLVVMINVIEHCFDVDLIFEKIYEMLDQDGIFLFHDKFVQEKNVNTIHDNYYDSGHPLKLTFKYVKQKIDGKFISIYRKSFVGEDDNEYVYMILKKK